MSLVVLWVPPRRLHQSIPTLWWSSMNSPYCCLMEMGTQTNEQPLPGSALQVLINPAAETLMALIFQTKRCLRLTASRHSHNKSVSIRDTAQRQRGGSVQVTPGLWSELPRCWKISPCSAHLRLWESTKWCRQAESLCLRIKGTLRRHTSANYTWTTCLQTAAFIFTTCL